MASPKDRVREHWEAETAGIRYGDGSEPESFYRSIEESRYQLEPFIPAFAQFESYAGKRILEVGVGGGTDFSQFVRCGALATGIDLTAAGIGHTARRLKTLGHPSNACVLAQADVESLPIRDNAVDLVYSWGVVYHTPATELALAEIIRVLKPVGTLKAMIYHTPSWTCWLLWVRHALLKFKPFMSPRQCVYKYLESPGTKAYTIAEAKNLFAAAGFTAINIRTELSPGDLLTIKASQRYQGALYRVIWGLYPRWLVRATGRRWGLYMLITAQKPDGPA